MVKEELVHPQYPPQTPEMLAGDTRVHIHLWQQQWYAMLKGGEIERLNKRELSDIDDFLVSTRDTIKSRLK